MKRQLQRKQERMGQVFEEYKSFRDSLPKDVNKWTPEQNEKFDRFESDMRTLDSEIDSLKRRIGLEDLESRYSEIDDGDNIDGNIYTKSMGIAKRGISAAGQIQSVNSNCLGGFKDPCDFRSNQNGTTQEHVYNRFLLHGERGVTSAEYRGMLAGSDIAGGYLTMPQVYANAIIKSVDLSVFMRQLATVHNLKQATSLGAVSLDDDFDDAEWTAELSTGSEDELEFGKRELTPSPIAKRVKVSNTLLRKSHFNPATLVTDRLSKRFAETEEKAYLLGSGSNQPLGVFTVSNDGIPTSRDVNTDNTATALTADNLIEVQGTLKEGYQKNATWLFHRDAITRLKKLKSSDDQYIWQPGLAAGQQNTILGKPYVISEYCPNTFTAGKYVGMYADFSYYWIAIGLDMWIQRLVERYAETNQTGFIGRLEADGMPVLSEAFVRIQMGS